MKLGAMQPYLFPYIGYYQLISAVDKYVIDDNVQYIQRGWINRNRILIQGKAHFFIFSIKGKRQAAHTLKINERFFSDAFEQEKQMFFKKLHHAYSRAPYYGPVIDLIHDIMRFPETNIAKFITRSIIGVCRYLQITTPFYLASQIPNPQGLRAADRVIDMNKRMSATQYINAIGGVPLYSRSQFAQHGIKLNFLKTREIIYGQFKKEFVPDLSIIDVMMFNPKTEIRKFLSAYDFV